MQWLNGKVTFLDIYETWTNSKCLHNNYVKTM